MAGADSNNQQWKLERRRRKQARQLKMFLPLRLSVTTDFDLRCRFQKAKKEMQGKYFKEV
ncbi:MAG TPA: hypothetical protein ENN57_01790 [Chloroflexi bacterium]|nr:hypothetical protein [Chloroflexota bacterium]